MRITQNMINENFMRNLSQNLRRLGDKNDMISSTKKIRRPSDDPVGAAMAMKLRRQVNAIEQYKSNAEDALSWMKTTESALTNIGEMLHRLKELSVQAANGPLSADDREKILYEVSELKEQIFNEANGTHVNRNLFSGFNTDKPAFIQKDGKIIPNPEILKANEVVGNLIDITEFGDKIAVGKYGVRISGMVGDTADIEILKLNDAGSPEGDPISTFTGIDIVGKVELEDGDFKFTLDFDSYAVSDGELVEFEVLGVIDGNIDYNLGHADSITTNLLGTDVFGGIFKTLEDFEAALESDDQDALSSDIIGRIDEATSDILKYRAQVGARYNRLEATISRLDINSDDYRDLLSKTEDIDVAQLIMELKMEENVYRLTLAAGARIIQPNLADFLR